MAKRGSEEHHRRISKGVKPAWQGRKARENARPVHVERWIEEGTVAPELAVAQKPPEFQKEHEYRLVLTVPLAEDLPDHIELTISFPRAYLEELRLSIPGET